MSGFDVLWDGFDKVVEKTDRGEEFTKLVIKMLEKRQEAEVKYAKAMSGLNSLFGDREDGTTKDFWNTMGAETASLAQSRDGFVAEIQGTLEELKQQSVADKKTRQDLVLKGKKLVKDLNNSEEICAQARQKYVSSRKTQQKSDETYKALKVKGVQKNIEKAEKTLKKDKEKANASDDEYRKTVIALAKHQDKYYSEDMPALLKEFEVFERTRILNTKRIFQNFIKNQTKISPAWAQSTERLQKKVDAITPDTDLTEFVNHNRSEQMQPPPRAQYMSWDGTLIEDLGPKRDTTPNITNNLQPIKSTTSPRVEETKQPAYQQPVQQPAVQVAQAIQPTQQANNNNATVLKQLVALYSYDATEDGELTFGEGAIIGLLEENDSGWWKGRLQNGSEGLFPSNFVEEQGKSTADSTNAGDGPNIINGNYVALYDYDADDDTEINIKEGDALFVETEKDGWYYGYRKVQPNQKGNFPSNFVEKA